MNDPAEILIIVGPHAHEMHFVETGDLTTVIDGHPYQIYAVPGTEHWLIGVSAWKKAPSVTSACRIVAAHFTSIGRDSAARGKRLRDVTLEPS